MNQTISWDSQVQVLLFVSSRTHMCHGSLTYARAELKFLGLFTTQYAFKHSPLGLLSSLKDSLCYTGTQPGATIAPDAQGRPLSCCSAPNLWHFMLQLYASNIWQLLCLHIGDIFIPALQLEVIFTSHKLHHRVFTSSRRQGEPRSHLVLAVTLSSLQGSRACSRDPARPTMVFQTFAMSKFFQRVPACILPRHFQGWVGKFLCSCYGRDSGYHGLGMETMGFDSISWVTYMREVSGSQVIIQTHKS